MSQAAPLMRRLQDLVEKQRDLSSNDQQIHDYIFHLMVLFAPLSRLIGEIVIFVLLNNTRKSIAQDLFPLWQHEFSRQTA